jgi:hypothetical protein
MYNANAILKAILKNDDTTSQKTFMQKLKSFWKKITAND